MDRAAEQGNPDCERCPLIGRRDFLRDAGWSVAAAAILSALGAVPASAAAAPVSFVSPSRVGDEEKSYPIPAADGTQIDKSNGTIVTRWQDKIYVYSLACPHQNTALRWYEKDSRFECPKHHSRFQPDGEYIEDSGRATRGLDRFAVRKDGANVVANFDRLYRQDDNPAEWNAAFITP
jgi:nitrite reductase/ring-hydroxylating ferredoxin subunit